MGTDDLLMRSGMIFVLDIFDGVCFGYFAAVGLGEMSAH